MQFGLQFRAMMGLFRQQRFLALSVALPDAKGAGVLSD
jgi:hypothetical protein